VHAAANMLPKACPKKLDHIATHQGRCRRAVLRVVLGVCLP